MLKGGRKMTKEVMARRQTTCVKKRMGMREVTAVR
jgi:hypothetical protein